MINSTISGEEVVCYANATKSQVIESPVTLEYRLWAEIIFHRRAISLAIYASNALILS